jgi:hypothetical protein
MGLVRTVAVVFGVVYVLAGIAGFVLDSPLFGLFDVNLVHNVVHILLGAVLLYGSTSTSTALMTTRAVGALLVLLGILGIPFPDGFDIVPLSGNDIWLHLASGVIMLAAGFMGANEPATA